MFSLLFEKGTARQKWIGPWLILIISFCLPSTVKAETIILESGQKIEGQIIEQTELRITVDIRGIPKTFYLGEIASIDGNKVDVLRPKTPDAGGKKGVPCYNEEMDSLIKFMDKHNAKASGLCQPVKRISSQEHAPAQQDIESLVHGMHEMMGKMADMNKNVVSTPDGGIIVVGPEKIVKYDKNLNVVKEIDLNPDSSAGSK